MIDVHVHCHQPEHRSAEWASFASRAYGDRDWSYTPEAVGEAMIEGGVDTAIVFGVTSHAAGAQTPNDFVEQFCARMPIETIPFMALDPSAPGADAQLEDGIARGFRGIKLYPATALFDPADERFDAFYRRAAEQGLVLLWHQGATPSPAGSLLLSLPFSIDEVARRHPDLTQIIAHMAHPWQREAIVVIRKNPRVFADVSATWSRPQDGFQALVRAQEWGVVDKLVFGSDYPHWTPKQAVDGLRAMAARRPVDWPHIEASTIEHLVESDHLAALGLR
ncbi:amidohydrolase family protein [Agromyces silvae]|uniref:amidohydrolase family protein n=1 Tax=Agromyces silvae TaxID=3388266 RepID=UPI00280B1312|nr:amidohydrolase family protein [Agromyces protaetiae]